jgi:SAM-dependent methyltransferase
MKTKFNQKEIIWTDDKATRLWNYYTNNSSYAHQYFSYHSGSFILRDLQKYVEFKGEILDFGCGPGHLISHLLKMINVGKVCGLDFSPDSAEKTNQRFENLPHFGGAFYAPSLPSDFGNDSMDLIVSIEVIEHLNDSHLHDMLTESHRLLKSNGKLVITTPNREDLEVNKTMCPECGCIFHRWQHVRSWNATDLANILNENNFIPEIVLPTFFQSRRDRMINQIIRFIKAILRKPSATSQPHLFAIAKKHA